jgi:hypothetical protein
VAERLSAVETLQQKGFWEKEKEHRQSQHGNARHERPPTDVPAEKLAEKGRVAHKDAGVECQALKLAAELLHPLDTLVAGLCLGPPGPLWTQNGAGNRTI